MALSYINAGAAQGETITIPSSHASGDLLLMFAWRDGSTTACDLPAGWTNVGINTGTLCATRVAFKVAASGSETSGTWTNATSLACHVYRGQKSSSPVVNSGGQTGTSTTINYSGIVTMTDPGNSWVARFAGISTNDTSLQTAPSGHTNRSNSAGAVLDEVAGHDTNGAVSSSSFGSVSAGGTSGNYITKTLEILYEPPAGGGTTARKLPLVGAG